MPIVELCKKLNQTETHLVAQAGEINIVIDNITHDQQIEQEKKRLLLKNLQMY